VIGPFAPFVLSYTMVAVGPYLSLLFHMKHDENLAVAQF